MRNSRGDGIAAAVVTAGRRETKNRQIGTKINCKYTTTHTNTDYSVHCFEVTATNLIIQIHAGQSHPERRMNFSF